MSDGAAIAVGLLAGAWGATNKVQTTINIHDGASGDLLWKYDYQASGSVGSSSTQLGSLIHPNSGMIIYAKRLGTAQPFSFKISLRDFPQSLVNWESNQKLWSELQNLNKAISFA
jgi:hypothetical protein